jgi:hypothetical protein
MGSEVRVARLPECDLCPRDHKQPAAYHSRTVFGSWAYLCEAHYVEFGVGQLGTGFGQRLILDSKEVNP